MTFCSLAGLFMLGCKMLHKNWVRPYADNYLKNSYFATMP